ncbi:MAG TPA: amino acid adenylation domain-containing protein, partial [Longimicrobium sp.]|nr:amino acid adenylation domain-containing protein [Longimicrobium sp.]
MTVPPEPAGTLSRQEKQERLRALLLEKIGRTRTAPASFAQERLWFLDRLRPDSASYNLPEAQRFSGPLDAEALERALGEVVRRHEALRTTFAEADGVPVQVIAPYEGFSLDVEDLSGLDADAREAEVARQVADDAARPFDLAGGPLLRTRLLRLGHEEHVLLLCMHHVVGDGWSMGVLFHELAVLYAAYAAGEEPSLPPPALQYADYAVRQRERLAGDALDREVAYWRERLAGAPTLLELPTDHPRPAVQTLEGAQVSAELSTVLLGRLQALARGEEATLYMVLLAAFQLLLGRYAGSDDVVVGSPASGRRGSDEEALIGFFVNTLALRTDLSGDPTFRQLLRRVREVTLDAYEHQEVPFERVVEELHPERSLSHSPVFQAMFTLHHGRGPRGALSALRMERVAAGHGTTKFDLTLGVGVEEGFRATLEYSTDLFEPATAARMLAHLERVLEQVAVDPDAPLSALELADAAERHQVVEEWNRTADDYPADHGLAALFAEQAARTPDAVAVECGDAALTYAQLDDRSSRLAHHLVRLGVGPEVRVGICLERSLEMVISLLAVLKAGGAYVPLDPGYPAERLDFMLGDAGVSVLVTQEALRESLSPRAGIRVVSVDGEWERIAAEPVDAPASAAGPGSLAYVMYTSGSTGRPRGVCVEHRSVVRLVRGARYAELGPDEVILQGAPVSFDAATFEIWGALLNGGRLVLMPGTRPSLEELGRTLVRHKVTTLWLTAGLFQVMVDERLEDLAGVRQLLAGGDVLPVDAVNRLRARFPSCRLINGYGPTENTTFTCCYTVPAAWSGSSLPIGSPISNTRVYVLEGSLRPAPVGVPGELYAGGAGVARGYLNRPALTAERFVPDPFGKPGARMYRTGDRARWRADGTVEYLGRLDAQVKVRGFRIELGEIETVLRRHEGVADCVVVAREDVPGDRRLVAYVVGDGMLDLDVDALRSHLRRSVPEYMVPAAFVVLRSLPLTPNGKVDRRALPAPELAGEEERYVAPRTPAEEVLAGIWAEVLRVERVGVEDDFFALGGHSLLATRVVSRVRQLFAVELPLRVLFEGPTVAELAKAVAALRRAGLAQLPPLLPVERRGPLPLSFAQERLWFLSRMEPDSPFYNVPAAIRLGGALDASALERALGEIVRRHEALRTVFRDAGGAPSQVIAPFAGFTLPVEDLSALGEAEREAEASRRASAEAARAFDLAAGPLFRARLLRLGAEDHVLLLTMHHVVSDGWSMGVLFRELSALYGAYREGRESPLADLAVQYADYAVWQREQLRGEVLDRQLAYWKERLAGAPALLELPTDRPRPAVQTYRGAEATLELPEGLLERLQALGRREGATLYMVLLAAFQALLSKYSGSEDVIVGTPIAGRTRGEVEGLIGFFVNTLVLQTDLSGDPGFREVLRRVREVTLGGYEHQDVPFEKLVAELQPERSLSHAPLFQVMLTLNDAQAMRVAGLPGLRMAGVRSDVVTTKFDLTLGFAVDAAGLHAVLEYNTDLFGRGTIDRMLRHLSRVLEQVAQDADPRLSELELLSADERQAVVAEWNRTEAEVPTDRCIHQLIEAQVERTPDAPAVVAEDAALTYRELNARANQLAHHLAGLGVGPEVRVGLCLERGLEMVVSILAVLKAGGAYVPLDPGYPAERLAYMLADSGVAVLLTQRRLRGILPGSIDLPVLDVETVSVEIAGGRAENPTPAVGPTNLAYVIYTSGSTGRPKGVMNQHGGVVNRLWWMQAEYGLDADDVVLQKTPFSFDVSVWEFFWPLQQGACLVMARPDGHRDPQYLQEVIEARGVTTLHFVPSMLRQFVETADAARCTSLTRVICSGEALPPALVQRFHERMPESVELHNLYGPTEAAVDVTYWACERAESIQVVPIGRPVWNTRMYVLDAGLRPVPAGVPGELYIGGVQVARGYLGRPALTAERFIPDPFASDGARLYRTVDRARWLESAEGPAAASSRTAVLEYLGRLDQQVKIRGFRIEPGEIESALLGHGGVREGAVVVREDEPGERRLVAYVVGDADAESLRVHLGRTLPEHMVPAAFVALDELPLTPNGKLDRGALPAPEYASGERWVAPRTQAEEVLAEMWADVLRLERVGVHDNFFELGGHSILATVVVGMIQAAFSVAMPLRALFEGPTVAELAERVEALRRAGAPQLPPVVPVERTGPPPLSFAQERLWFLDRLQPESAFYNVATALRLQGALDTPALERALGEVVRRHEVLRTVFREEGGAPVQVIAPFRGFRLPVEDLSRLDEAEREAEAQRRAGDEAARPFDLSAGPLFRAGLLRLGAEEHLLLLTMHHIVTDWWSTGILSRELSSLYGAYHEGRESPLAEPGVQYADFTVWQREQLRGAVLDRQLAYWKERLAGAPALLELPTDHPRPALQTYRGSSIPVDLSAELRARLRALGQREGATLYMVVLGAFQVLLGRYAGSDDVGVGTSIAGRTRREVEALVGFFVNTLALRTDLSGDPTFRQLLRRVREVTLGAYDHQDVPFEHLVAELQPERSLSHSPVFQAMFTWGAAHGVDGGLPGLRTHVEAPAKHTAKFDLSLGLGDHPGGLRGFLEYSTDLFERDTVERMLRHLERVLELVVANPDVRLSELELADAAERHQMLDAWNRTDAVYPADRGIHQLFDEQVAETPDVVAAEFGDASLTFRELNRRANRLAHHLIRLGVGPEVRVGICLERNLEMVISLLAVLKAGGAYVPLDPGYPAERLDFMLGDAGVSVLVTQEALREALSPRAGIRVVSVDGEWERIAAEPVDAPASAAGPGSLAYVMYTSGSTGRPRGVCVEHRSVVRLVRGARYAELGPDEVILQGAPVSFDAATFEIWGALLNGGRLVLMPGTRPSLEELGRTLVRHRVTTLWLTAGLFQVMVDERLEDLAGVRQLLAGGDVLPVDAVNRLRARFPACRLINGYGPTENTTFTCCYTVPAAWSGSSLPIGSPISNTRVYVLEGSLRPAPVGV